MNAYTDLTLKLRAGRRNFRDTDVRPLLAEMEALRATNAKLRQGQAEAKKECVPLVAPETVVEIHDEWMTDKHRLTTEKIPFVSVRK